MGLAQEIMTIETPGQGLHEVTSQIASWTARQKVRRGVLTIFIRHTSASLLIQENAAPAVRRDLAAFMRRLAPEDGKLYEHDDEGPDDMPAHIRAALTPSHLAIPVDAGRLLLGAWQGIYVFEHRRAPHRRELALNLAGD